MMRTEWLPEQIAPNESERAAHEVQRARLEEWRAGRLRAVPASLAPLPAQIDLDGGLHELAPQTEAMRLFEPAPRVAPGQTGLSDAELGA